MIELFSVNSYRRFLSYHWLLLLFGWDDLGDAFKNVAWLN